MTLQSWNGDELLQKAKEEVARRLLAAAILLQSEMIERLNTDAGRQRRTRTRDTVAGKKGSTYTVYTNPSKPGEFLHKRQGLAQANVTYEPTTPAEVAALGKIRLGYRPLGKHGAIWELKGANQRRKGLIDLAIELRGQLQGVMARRAT